MLESCQPLDRKTFHGNLHTSQERHVGRKPPSPACGSTPHEEDAVGVTEVE
jgi:hypothetical protein